MNDWKKFLLELKEMTFRGFKKPAPLFYFISIIVIAGGVGVWIPWISSGQISSQSVMTYIFALLAAVIADFMTQEEKRGSYSKDMSVFIIAVVVLIICTTVIALRVCEYSLLIIFVSLFLLWWLWWILLEEKKFDLTQEGVKQATIGMNTEEPDSESKSLAAFKKAKKGSEK